MNHTEEREERLYGSESMEDTGQTQSAESRSRAQALVVKGSSPDPLCIYYACYLGVLWTTKSGSGFVCPWLVL